MTLFIFLLWMVAHQDLRCAEPNLLRELGYRTQSIRSISPPSCGQGDGC